MYITITKANGTGTCVECRKPIKKGDTQLVAQGFQQAGRWCIKCIDKMRKEFDLENNKK